MSTVETRFKTFGVGFILSIGGFVTGQIVATIAIFVLMAVGIDVLNSPGIELLVSAVMLQGVAFGGIALVYLDYRNLGLDFIHVRFPSLRDAGIAVGGFILLFAALDVISLIIQSLGLHSAQNSVVDIASGNPAVFLLLIPLSFLLIAPGEELLYRGLIQGVLRESYSPVPAIILSSVLFASIHFFSLIGADAGRLVYIGVVFALALVLGSVYEYTDNLLVPIFIHGAYDAVQFGLKYLVLTGRIHP